MKLVATDGTIPAISYTAHRQAAQASVTAFYDPETGSIQYILTDPVTRRSAIIDPVLDFTRGRRQLARHPLTGCCPTLWPMD